MWMKETRGREGGVVGGEERGEEMEKKESMI